MLRAGRPMAPAGDAQHGLVLVRRAEPRRAAARAVRLGDVRLRQLGLHHRGHHGGVCGLLRGRRGGRGRLGAAGVDGGAVHFLRHRHAHHAQPGRVGRPAWREEKAADLVHGGLRRRHCSDGAGASRRRAAGDGAHHRLQHLLLVWRVADRGLPARAGAARSHGQGQRLGLGFRLSGRHADAGRLPGVCAACAKPGTGRVAVRAGHAADHGGGVCAGCWRHLRAAARAGAGRVHPTARRVPLAPGSRG